MNSKRMLNAMKEESTHAVTENGGKTYSTTMNGLMDLFALAGSYRTRSDENCILLFKKAFSENPDYAMKCLFYLGDIIEGQGERRFFRTIIRWLAQYYTITMRKNLPYIPEFNRWDTLYSFVGTPLEKDAFDFMARQLVKDIHSNTPSLLAKWLKSENTSSEESRRLATKTRSYLRMTSKEYRKMLSVLRERIRVLERIMSAQRWDEIDFSKIPSKAGFNYRKAFEHNEATRERYLKFVQDKNKTVNAFTLYPADVVHQARNIPADLNSAERYAVNKYWDNLKDYIHNAVFDGVAVVDTSSSMTNYANSLAPIDAAIAIGMYCAEKCSPNSPWHGHYISFSCDARLVPIEGVDFVDKVHGVLRKNLCQNTNIASVFDLLLSTAMKNHLPQIYIPKNIIILSDMEFDNCAYFGTKRTKNYQSELEAIEKKWNSYGYEMPHLIFWNLQARQDNIPMKDNGNVTFVSGMSPAIMEQILMNKKGIDLVMEKLNSERYAKISY